MQKDFKEVFYSRQTVLKELGEAGQEKLSNARVAVVGVGGLGSVSSLYLALAGVGYIRVIDQDTLEPHNLHRQILYRPSDLRYPKAEVAAKKLLEHNPLIQVDAASENLNQDNAKTLLSGVDVVVDGLDNVSARHIVNRAAAELGVPYVFGAAIGFEGNLSVFYPPKTGCLECFMPNNADADHMDRDTCNRRGILGATAGAIGTLQALETIKLITGIGEPLLGKLLVCDFTDMNFTVLPLHANPQCPVCRGESKSAAEGSRLVWLCGEDTANINPQKPLSIPLEAVYERVRQHFDVLLKSKLALRFVFRGFEVTLFGGGRMLIKGVKDEKEALDAYSEVFGEISQC
ncbi:MAG: HesA/MoeB/ThiF family protein [Candidatus Bathyarchaeota archaeon]|nr:HesA/MoeB/ThiF family protein [Candidatus Bathyarchaeota archaeon]